MLKLILEARLGISHISNGEIIINDKCREEGHIGTCLGVA